MVEKMINAVYQSSIVPPAEREVARIKVAQLNACGACSGFRAPSAVASGVSEDLYEHIDEYETYEGYTDRQRLAIEYASRFVIDHGSIDDELFGKLRRVFSDPEILDLTLCIAVYLGLGRSLAVLGIEEHTHLEI